MALKDWKKAEKDLWKKGRKVLSVVDATSYDTEDRYEVVLAHPESILGFPPKTVKVSIVLSILGKFRTKSEALKFAKAYMKKH